MRESWPQQKIRSSWCTKQRSSWRRQKPRRMTKQARRTTRRWKTKLRMHSLHGRHWWHTTHLMWRSHSRHARRQLAHSWHSSPITMWRKPWSLWGNGAPVGHPTHGPHPVWHSLLIKHASLLQLHHIDLRVQFLDRYVAAPQVQVPVVLPLLVLHAFPRSPGQGYRFTMESEFVKIFESSVCIHPSVHAHKGTATGWNEVDGDNLSISTKIIRKVILLNQFGEMANPEGGAAHCKMSIFKRRKPFLLPFFHSLNFLLFILLSSLFIISVPLPTPAPPLPPPVSASAPTLASVPSPPFVLLPSAATPAPASPIPAPPPFFSSSVSLISSNTNLINHHHVIICITSMLPFLQWTLSRRTKARRRTKPSHHRGWMRRITRWSTMSHVRRKAWGWGSHEVRSSSHGIVEIGRWWSSQPRDGELLW